MDRCPVQALELVQPATASGRVHPHAKSASLILSRAPVGSSMGCMAHLPAIRRFERKGAAGAPELPVLGSPSQIVFGAFQDP